MSLDCFKYIYNLKECRFWPTLKRRQDIPDPLKSRRADPNRPSKFGLGFAEAAGFVLTGQVTLGRDGNSLSVRYTGNQGGERLASVNQQPTGKRIWHDANSMKAPAFLAIAEAMLLRVGAFRETRTRWEELLQALAGELGHRPTYTQNELAGASTSPACSNAVLALSDALYFEIKAAFDGHGYVFGYQPDDHAETDLDPLFGPSSTTAGPTPWPTGVSSLTATLTALIATGGTALLVGPTGTFKTTTAKQAAIASSAHLTVVKGRPGLEDRDFFGTVTPAGGGSVGGGSTESGPTWVDGPVTRAFRAAQQGPAVLLIDELLRFEPYYLGALVGLLDTDTPRELESRGITPLADGPHYALELPTGERLAAPAANLTLIATTNMGADYVQSVTLDAALMGRFELLVEVERADEATCDRLYREAAGEAGFAEGARLLHDLEDFTRAHHLDEGGLLARRAHPRLMLSMAGQMERLKQAGMAPAEAAKQAAEVTVLPYCTERGPDGLLDRSGAQLLRDETERLAARLD